MLAFYVLISTLCLSPINLGGAAYSTTYVKLNVTNNAAAKSITVCANIQPFKRNSSNAQSLKSALVINEIRRGFLCSDEQELNLSGQVIVDYYSNYIIKNKLCSPKERVLRGQTYKAGGFLFRAENLFSLYRSDEFDNDTTIDIPVFYINEHNYQSIEGIKGQDRSEDISLKLILYNSPWFRGAFVIILMITVLCVTLGGLWSGHKRIALTLSAAEIVKREPCEVAPSFKEGDRPAEPLNCLSLGFLLLIIVTFLLLFYYFFSVLVWFVIVFFTVLTSVSTYACLCQIWEMIFGNRFDHSQVNVGRLLSKICRCFTIQPDSCAFSHRQIITYIISASISIAWCILRKNPYSFILHTLLSTLFCIHAIANIRIQSLKWITALMTAMLVYDLFMVFLTPFFTSEGCSIMVQAVTGESCTQKRISPPDPFKEDIPIVFRIPDFTDPMIDCYNITTDLQYPPMILGLGDVIVPGVLIGFNLAFDLGWKTKCHLYFTISVFGYASGMIVTFLALILMRMAQPALIYLVPFTLIPTHLIALCKGHWWLMWQGNVLKEVPVAPNFGAFNVPSGEDDDGNNDRQPLEEVKPRQSIN